MSQDRSRGGPTRGASIIPFEELLENQRAVIKGVNDRLHAMHREPQATRPVTLPPQPAYPRPPIIEKRFTRTTMIDNHHGTGKTAILLTVLRGWRRNSQRAN